MRSLILYLHASLAHLQAEHKVAADALLSDDVLHGAQGGAQIGVEELCGQQTHRGGHQVVWQGHICDLKAETKTLPQLCYGIISLFMPFTIPLYFHK